METISDSNCHSVSDSFSLYECYMRSFCLKEGYQEPDNAFPDQLESSDSSDRSSNHPLDISSNKDIRNPYIQGYGENNSHGFGSTNNSNDNSVSLDKPEIINPKDYFSYSNDRCDTDTMLTIAEENTNHDKSETQASSENTVSDNSIHPKPIVITSLISMENSNNAVDSVPLYNEQGLSESNVFKLPITELSFNGTIKNVQKLKPIVDPITALSSVGESLHNNYTINDNLKKDDSCIQNIVTNMSTKLMADSCSSSGDRSIVEYIDVNELSNDEKTMEGSNETNLKHNPDEFQEERESKQSRWSYEHSFSPIDTSFDSGVRSPDVFSDDDTQELLPTDNYWSFIKEREETDKRKVKKMEEILQGVLPPPSVTILRKDATEMLNKYYCFLPIFNDGFPIPNPEEVNSTPSKRVSVVKIPSDVKPTDLISETASKSTSDSQNFQTGYTQNLKTANTLNLETSLHYNLEQDMLEHPEVKMNPELPQNDLGKETMCSETDAKETTWPDVLKCKYHDVYYNVTAHSETLELLGLKYGERYVGAETASTVTVHALTNSSPSSTQKKKALRIKSAQNSSPGRRLSHLARRRQTFCSASTLNGKANSTSKMILIDKNFFPHRKLTYTSNDKRKSPRIRRTPGRKTPGKKTPGKKTPGKTQSRHTGSSHKKAMRRLLINTDSVTQSQPTRQNLRRALFISPNSEKVTNVSSMPHAVKSRRTLFHLPSEKAKSLDGTTSNCFLKRKRDLLDDTPENEKRSKISKSLSFGGDTIVGSQESLAFSRRASEVLTSKNTAELSELHKKKLLWAVSEALRVHGWRMGSPGFREKATALARLTRRLLALPQHAARLDAPRISTSEIMLRLARQYVFAIIQGRSTDDCYMEEQAKLANEANNKLTGYISATTYQQMKARQPSTCSTITSKIKENTCDSSIVKNEQCKSGTKNVLQDKLVNIDSNSSSNSHLMDKAVFFKSNSMPSFHETAKMRARRHISFDNMDFPKR